MMSSQCETQLLHCICVPFQFCRCNVSQHCLELMTQKRMSGYTSTHQVYYLIVLRQVYSNHILIQSLYNSLKHQWHLWTCRTLFKKVIPMLPLHSLYYLLGLLNIWQLPSSCNSCPYEGPLWLCLNLLLPDNCNILFSTHNLWFWNGITLLPLYCAMLGAQLPLLEDFHT